MNNTFIMLYPYVRLVKFRIHVTLNFTQVYIVKINITLSNIPFVYSLELISSIYNAICNNCFVFYLIGINQKGI